jgi:hypothetical protein
MVDFVQNWAGWIDYGNSVLQGFLNPAENQQNPDWHGGETKIGGTYYVDKTLQNANPFEHVMDMANEGFQTLFPPIPSGDLPHKNETQGAGGRYWVDNTGGAWGRAAVGAPSHDDEGNYLGVEDENLNKVAPFALGAGAMILIGLFLLKK